MDNLNEFATPTLMRAARGVYASSIRAHLRAVGVDDLPRNGAFILAGIRTSDGPRQDLPALLGISKQAVSHVIDILVSRGFVARGTDPGDRRRISLSLTALGQQAVAAVYDGVEAVDQQLEQSVSHDQVATMRSVLIAMSQIKSHLLASGPAPRRQARQFRSFSPIFPVRDLSASLAHYSALGFTATGTATATATATGTATGTATAGDGGFGYGFADRDGTQLHLQEDPGHDHDHGKLAYLYVRDADALHAEWTRPGIGGVTRPVRSMPYQMREGVHIDPDGNMIRFGSPIEDVA